MKPHPSSRMQALRETLDEGGPACRRVRARMRLCRMKLRREGKLYAAGYEPPVGSSVQRLWREAGWRPSRWVWSHADRGFRPFRDPTQERGLSLPSPTRTEVIPIHHHTRSRRAK